MAELHKTGDTVYGIELVRCVDGKASWDIG